MKKTKQNYKTEIAKEICRIINLENNKDAANKFWEIMNNIKPKACIVKTVWHSGNNINFLLAFEKGGNKKPFDLFIENIENVSERYGFICGLWTEKFHFNHQQVIENKTHFFIDIKLKK